MKRRHKSLQPKKKPLAVLTSEERVDYATRLSLFQTKQQEARAAGHYLDILGEDFKEKYKLPPAYDLNLETGEIYERPQAEVNDG